MMKWASIGQERPLVGWLGWIALFWAMVPFHMAHAGRLELIGQTGGKFGAVATENNIMCIGEGFGLAIWDVTDPVHPVKLSRVQFPESSFAVFYSSGRHDKPAEIVDVKLSNKRAYVSNGASLKIVDLSSPASPRILSSCGSFHGLMKIRVLGHLVFITSPYEGFWIVDASDPRYPIMHGPIIPGGWLFDVDIDGQRMYAIVDGTLWVYDISNLYAPKVLGSVTTPYTGLHSIRIHKGAAILTAYKNIQYSENSYGTQYFLATMKLSASAMPTLVNELELKGGTNLPLEVFGDTLYLFQYKVIEKFDIHDPFQFTRLPPIPIADTPSTGHFIETTEQSTDGRFLILSGEQQFNILSIDQPSTSTLLKQIVIPDAYMTDPHMLVRDGWVYAISWMRLFTYDVRQPTKPLLQEGFMQPEENYTTYFLSMTMNDQYLYLGLGHQDLDVIDLSQPANPIKIGSWLQTPGATDLEIQNGRAYLLSGKDLLIYKMAEPTSPTLLGRLTLYLDATSTRATEVLPPGVRSSTGGLLAYHLVVVGSKAYVTSGITTTYYYEVDEYHADREDYKTDAYLHTIDISDPAHPIQLASQALAWCDGQLLAYKHHLVMSASQTFPEHISKPNHFGLSVVDLTAAGMPEKVDNIELAKGISNLTLFGGHLCWADYFHLGLYDLDDSHGLSQVAEVAIFNPSGFAVSGDLIYLLDESRYLSVLRYREGTSSAVAGPWNLFE